MTWHQHKKDANYYNRLALASKVKKLVETFIQFNTPLPIDVPYTYNGGKKTIISIERYKYMSQFKREFTVIRVAIDDGTYVKLDKLRTKHLTAIYQQLKNVCK